ncbi:MAG: hypothetical protein NC344_10240 [Bacteroidales bacterium]|nr:hypothetical protein [Bacteroidales bacterium]MCM1148183.1 hypothetical protein [Bacteroidales bacterium]MCM1207090.1 hypothetical protein [Bacillota bacterium]MCM1510834.1 hypothetical protein [Clostridium sp.]
MNNKEKYLNDIVDIVIKCCAMELSDGRMSLTREDVIGKSRSENAVISRCLLVMMVISAGFSITTAAQLLGRTTHSVRHLLKTGHNYRHTSRAFRVVHDEASAVCHAINKGVENKK